MTTPLKADVLAWFGLPRDPFGRDLDEGRFYASPEVHRAVNLVTYALLESEWVALIGDIGTGKTSAVTEARLQLEAAEGIQAVFIELGGSSKKKVAVSTVLDALLKALGDDAPPHSVQKKAWKAHLSLAQAVQQGRRFVLVLDEAHRLTGEFLKDLKELHEKMRFGHRAALFGVVLLGHKELEERYKKAARDVYARLAAANIATFGKLTAAEAADYVRHRAGDLFDKDARELIGRMANTPVRINEICWALMGAAYLQGHRTIAKEQALLAYDRVALAKQLDLSLETIAAASGLGKSTVADVLGGRGSAKSRAAVDAVLTSAAPAAQEA